MDSPPDPFQRWSPVPGEAAPARFTPRPRADRPEPPPWADVDARAIVESMKRVLQKPRTLLNVRNWWRLFKRWFDLFGHVTGRLNDLLVRLNPYPPPFRKVAFPSADGTMIAGWLGLQDVRRPGLVVVPGMFSTKDDTVHKHRAIRIWRRWNYNVLVIDLRGFGQSASGLNTPGWKESEDVLAAARFLREFNSVTRVGLLAESLAGAATLLALAEDGKSAVPVVTSCMTICAFADARTAAQHISTLPPREDPFYGIHRLFQRLLRYRSKGRFEGFTDYLSFVAHHYGIGLEELYERSQPKNVVQDVRAPLLCLHAEDDHTVPVAHARILEHLLRDKRNAAVWTVPWGEHCAFEVLDRRWYWTVTHLWFERTLETPWSGRAPSAPQSAHSPQEYGF